MISSIDTLNCTDIFILESIQNGFVCYLSFWNRSDHYFRTTWGLLTEWILNMVITTYLILLKIISKRFQIWRIKLNTVLVVLYKVKISFDKLFNQLSMRYYNFRRVKNDFIISLNLIPRFSQYYILLFSWSRWSETSRGYCTIKYRSRYKPAYMRT